MPFVGVRQPDGAQHAQRTRSAALAILDGYVQVPVEVGDAVGGVVDVKKEGFTIDEVVVVDVCTTAPNP